MAKEKNYNPVAAHNKAQKARQIKKNRATVAQQRNEKLAKRNPDRLQKQIEELELADANGKLRTNEKRRLEELKRDLGRVKKARERMGVEEQPERRERDDRGEGGVLGKRRRDDNNRPQREEQSSETDDDVRGIPMPKDVDNMPPLPRRRQRGQQPQSQSQSHTPQPQAPSQKTYEAKPQIRNLIQEATSRFVPSSVASRTKNPSSHTSKLMEPEELDKQERKA